MKGDTRSLDCSSPGDSNGFRVQLIMISYTVVGIERQVDSIDGELNPKSSNN